MLKLIYCSVLKYKQTGISRLCGCNKFASALSLLSAGTSTNLIFSSICIHFVNTYLLMSWILRKLKHQEVAEQTSNFIKNGGILLEKLIQSSNGKYYPFRSFSFKEIMAATHHFNKENSIEDDLFRLHKGYLCDRLVCIHKYRHGPCCFNDMVFTAQIRHKNAPKLIGCCLEREIPLVVFEFLQK